MGSLAHHLGETYEPVGVDFKGSSITVPKGTKYCSITYTAEGQTRSVAIPEIMDFAVEGIAAGRGNEPIRLENVGHPMSSVLTLARGTASTYNDHGMSWDNTGKNGHYAAFEWQWP